MERHSVRETASLEGVDAGGALLRGSRHATELAQSTLHFLGEERPRHPGPAEGDRRRYRGIDARLSIGTAIRAFVVVTLLRGNR